MKTHELKVLPEYYERIASGQKKFEIRNNDRDFQVGDLLRLHMWTPGVGYAGDGMHLEASIIYITSFEQREGYVVMGIELTEKRYYP